MIEPVIDPTAIIGPDVEIGDLSVVGEHVQIKGNVKIGRKAWIAPYAQIGGGRSELGSLVAGDFFHMGEYSFINIADEVKIGHEVGLGTRTALYTHGGYLSTWNGFPHRVGRIHLGDNVWLPKATVLPNVMIGSRVVVMNESVVSKDLPPCCLAGGIPTKVIKENCYPLEHKLTFEQKHAILGSIIMSAHRNYNVTSDCKVVDKGNCILVGDLDSGTFFFPTTRALHGPVTKDTEAIRNLLRREGIRFRYYEKDGEYAEWD